MRNEIEAATEFLCKCLGTSQNLEDELELFKTCLQDILTEKYTNHWYVEMPIKGQAYRCLRINKWDPNEPSINAAARRAGMRSADIKLPIELTLWVDPEEVTCRFGERKGSLCTIASFKNGDEKNNIDIIDIKSLSTDTIECENGEDSYDTESDISNTSPTMQYYSPSSGVSSVSSVDYVDWQPSNLAGYASPSNSTSPVNIAYMQQPIHGINAYGENSQFLYPHRNINNYKPDWANGYPAGQSHSLIQLSNGLMVHAPDYFNTPGFLPNFVNNLKWVNSFQPTV